MAPGLFSEGGGRRGGVSGALHGSGPVAMTRYRFGPGPLRTPTLEGSRAQTLFSVSSFRKAVPRKQTGHMPGKPWAV